MKRPKKRRLQVQRTTIRRLDAAALDIPNGGSSMVNPDRRPGDARFPLVVQPVSATLP